MSILVTALPQGGRALGFTSPGSRYTQDTRDVYAPPPKPSLQVREFAETPGRPASVDPIGHIFSRTPYTAFQVE